MREVRLASTDALKVGLKINALKTECLLIRYWDLIKLNFLLSGPIKKVDDFKYLDSWLKDYSFLYI